MAWPTTAKDWVDIIQSTLTILAIFVGGYWSFRLYRQKRQSYPRASVEHHIVHRSIGHGKVLLHVTTRVTNIGEVLLPIRFATTSIEQILPIHPDLENAIAAGSDLIVEGYVDIAWPLLGKREVSAEKAKADLEPTEGDDQSFDFIVDSTVETVLVYSYFRNVKKYRGPIMRTIFGEKGETGWEVSTIYDLKQSAHSEPPLSQDNSPYTKAIKPKAARQQQIKQTIQSHTSELSSEPSAKIQNVQRELERVPSRKTNRQSEPKVPTSTKNKGGQE